MKYTASLLLALSFFGVVAIVSGTDNSECQIVCTRIYRPVCGSDNNTYGNRCTLRAHNCEHDTDITVAYRGGCRAAPRCPTVCPLLFSPVCGSNNQTYSNMCELRRARCEAGSTITRLHRGACSQDCPQICMMVLDRVCGTDGVTYSNRCVLRSMNCGTNVRVAHNGPCT